MRISPENVALANELRIAIQDRTETVSDGEGVAMVLLWAFLSDHLRHSPGVADDMAALARFQLEAFIEHGAPGLEYVRSH